MIPTTPTALLFLAAAAACAATPENVAVGELTGQGVDQSSAAIITDRLRTELFKTGAFTVIERQAMDQILKEQGFQQSGCVTDQCMVEMGQLLGVSRFVAGTVGKLGDVFTLNIRVIDVASGRIVFTESVDCECPISKVMTTSTPAIAQKIAANARPPAARAVSPAAQPQPQPAPAPPAPGSLALRSEPSGARVTLDSADAGLTPCTLDSLSPGPRLLRLELAGYQPVEERLTVVAGKRTERSYSLRHTKAWSDSARAAEQAAAEEERKARAAAEAAKPKKPFSPWPKVITAAAAAAGAGAGWYFDTRVKARLADAEAAQSAYLANPTPSTYNANATAYTDARKKANAMGLYRNLSYGAAGLCAVGFAVSWAF